MHQINVRTLIYYWVLTDIPFFFSADETQVQVLVKEKSDVEPPATIPYTECIQTCDECFCTMKWPPESNICICYNHSESIQSKKEAAVVRFQNQLQEVKLSSSKPVAKPVGGFIPYPECMEKCDECVICTKNLPIEKSLCYCGKKTDSNSKKPALEYAGN